MPAIKNKKQDDDFKDDETFSYAERGIFPQLPEEISFSHAIVK